MPLYEYFCTSCQRTFETMRPAKDADSPANCPACQHASSQRILSLFASSVKSNGATSSIPMSCGGGACGCHN